MLPLKLALSIIALPVIPAWAGSAIVMVVEVVAPPVILIAARINAVLMDTANL